ncbi:hypothetical protein EVG20_g9050 [Dentipellis fragilis]|uniref:DUF6533 domain-containing protein n=1 Tax=Dentipellis fragilis TaxID=205917 RepID=A0A4Y9Y2H9_9AGAM|nr:hypothetical protein EVG20_g9050 [Dentipellis fragilis]
MVGGETRMTPIAGGDNVCSTAARALHSPVRARTRTYRQEMPESCDVLCELQLDVRSLVPQMRANYAVTLLSLVILYYDFVLTLPQEIELYWPSQHPLGWASSIFLANRYLTVLGHFPVLAELFLTYRQAGVRVFLDVSCRRLTVGAFLSRRVASADLDPVCSCIAIQGYHNYYIVLLQIFVAALCFLRIYALYDRNVGVIWFFASLGIGAFALGTWSNLAAGKKSSASALPHILPIDIIGCHSLTPKDVGKRRRQVMRTFTAVLTMQPELAIAWTGVLVIDCSVFFMTLYRASRIQMQGRLLHILVRDGAMYFLWVLSLSLTSARLRTHVAHRSALFLTNLSNVLLFLLGPPASKGTLAIFTNVYVEFSICAYSEKRCSHGGGTSSLSATLINRLMLNLRKTNLPRRPTTDDASHCEEGAGENRHGAAGDASRSAAPFSTVLVGPGMGYSVYAPGEGEEQMEMQPYEQRLEEAGEGENAHGIELVPVRREPP